MAKRMTRKEQAELVRMLRTYAAQRGRDTSHMSDEDMLNLAADIAGEIMDERATVLPPVDWVRP